MRIRDEYLHGSDLTGVVKKIEVTIGTGNNANKSVIKYIKADSEGGIVEVPIGDITGKAATASKLDNTSAIGSKTNPVYFTANGVPSACTYSLNATVPAGAANKVLYYSAQNTLDVQSYTTLTSNLDVFTAATSSADGKKGLVPAPSANQLGAGNFFLRADGVWTVIENKTAALNGTNTSLVTTGEKYNWNSAYNWYNSMTSGDTDGIINKWKEVEAFLANYGDSSTLAAELAKLVTLSTDQTITGVKTFSLAINADITGDADTLDGKHASEFSTVGHTHSYLPLTGGTMSNTNKVTNLNADLLDGYHVQSTSNTPFATIPAINKNGWMEVGRHFEFHYDNTTNSDYSTILQCTGNYSNIVSLPSNTGTLALLTDNVASATKLQTARTIWGQNFDGTGNVNGTLTEVGNIIPLASNTYTIGQEGNEFSTGDIRVLYTRHLESARSYTGDTNLYIQYKQKGNTLMLVNGGNVGIGTEDPSYKLHVAGDIYTTDGFKKEGSNDNYVLLGGGGHKAESSLSVNYAASAGSVDWSGVTNKPSYSFSEITPGVATIGDGANRLMFRTNETWKSGMYYSTSGGESMVFANISPGTSWIFAHTDPTANTDWTTLTPSLQIKNGRVTVNKLIANGTNAAYNLDVNGSANANELYENGVRVSVDGHTHSYLPLSGGTMSGQFICDYNLINQSFYTWRNSRQHNGEQGRADDFILLQKADGSFNAHFGTFGQDTTDNYIFIGYDNYYGRNLRIGPSSLTWGDDTILHSGNYNSYAPKLDGTGASGTWGINISGNADTVNTLSTLYKWDGDVNTLDNYISAGKLHNASNAPVNYYSFLSFGANNYYTQINCRGDNFYMRSKSEDGWHPWRYLYHSGNLTKVSQLTNDAKYLTSHAYSYGSIDIYDVNGAKKTSNNTVSASVNTETLRLQEGANIAITAINSGEPGSDVIKIAVTGIESNINQNGYGQLALWYNGASSVSATLQSATFNELLTVKAGSGIDFSGVNGIANKDVWTISAIPYNCAIPLNNNSAKSLIKDSWSADKDSVYLTSNGTSSGTSLAAGTYALWIEDRSTSSGTPNYYSGTFTCAGSATAGRLDEIALHSSMATSADTNAPTRIFVATQISNSNSNTPGKHVLRFCSLDSKATPHYLTVKVNRII